MLAVTANRRRRRPREQGHAFLRCRSHVQEKPLIPGRDRGVSGRRYYSPSQGRFLGRDPKQEDGGLNLYGFVRNNPIMRWDVLGMSEEEEGDEDEDAFEALTAGFGRDLILIVSVDGDNDSSDDDDFDWFRRRSDDDDVGAGGDGGDDDGYFVPRTGSHRIVYGNSTPPGRMPGPNSPRPNPPYTGRIFGSRPVDPGAPSPVPRRGNGPQITRPGGGSPQGPVNPITGQPIRFDPNLRPPSPGLDLIRSVGQPGGTRIRVVDSEAALDDLFRLLSQGGTPVQGPYPGAMVRLPDGTLIGLRPTSLLGGATIDFHVPGGRVYKVHVTQPPPPPPTPPSGTNPPPP